MKSRVEKDKIKRFFFQSFGYCLKRQTSSLKFRSFFIRRKPFISFVSIRNRCVINFKSRFLINQFKVSRFVFRQQALLGNFKNVLKQSWLILFFALMVEMVDTKDSKSFTLDSVLVQIQLRVLLFTCKFYMTNRLLFFYKNVIQKDLTTQQNTFSSVNNTQIDKVHIYLSLKPFNILNPKVILAGWFFIEALTGQKVNICFSRKDVAQWRLRKGMLVGFSVVLRKDNIFSFLDKFFLLIRSQKKPFNAIDFDLTQNSFQVPSEILATIIELTGKENFFQYIHFFDLSICLVIKQKQVNVYDSFFMFRSFLFPFIKN